MGEVSGKGTPSCGFCAAPLTEKNRSREHLIQNALGGRRKTDAALCGRCNNETGHRLDKHLVAELSEMCVLFNIRRERRQVPGVMLRTVAGGSIRAAPDGEVAVPRTGSPVIEVETPNGTELRIRADNWPEFRKAAAGVARRRSGIDVEAMMRGAREERISHSGIAEVPFYDAPRSLEARLAVVKMAACMAMDSGVPAFSCRRAFAAMRDGSDTVPVHRMQTIDLIPARPPAVALHCVAVAGIPARKLLLGYVELFSVQRLVVVLATDYAGPALETSYVVDPATGRAVLIPVRLCRSGIDVERLMSDGYVDEATWWQFTERVAAPAGLRRQQQECRRVVEDLAGDVMAEMGHGRRGPVPLPRVPVFQALFAQRVQELANREPAFGRHLLRAAGLMA